MTAPAQTKPREKPPPHHNARMARRQVLTGAALLLLGLVLGFMIASPIAGAALGILGGLLILLGLWLRRTGVVAQILNPSYDAISRGDLTRAEALLQQVDVGSSATYIQRVIALQRASIAWRRGDADTLCRHATTALALSNSSFLFSREHDALNALYARSLRAVGRAVAGDLSGAESDLGAIVEAERSGQGVAPECLSQAALATALMHQRRADRPALRAHLATHRTLLSDYGIPAERALVRAMSRMLRVESRSVYRDKPEETPGVAEAELAVHDWIRTVAPEAAAFARPRQAGAAASSKSVMSAVHAAPPVRGGPPMGTSVASAKPRAVQPKRTTVLTCLVLVLIAAVGVLLNALSGGAPAGDHADALIAVVALLGFFAALGAVAYRVTVALRQQRSGQRALFKASAQIARGDFDGAEGELAKLTDAKATGVAAQAWLQLALVAERRADWPRALECCERAVTRATESEAAYISTVDLVLPSISGVRATVLAAMGRDDDVDAEMAAHHEKFPTSAYRTKIDFTVRLVQLARAGRVAEAAELVERDAESLALPARVTLLADLVRAVGLGVGAEERLRLNEELRDDARSRAWVSAVAPELVLAFEDARDSPDEQAAADASDGGASDELTRQAHAEEEASALEEIEADERLTGRLQGS